jgi:hypothetical protein
VLYWLRDFVDETDPHIYGTSGVLRVFSKDSVKYYPAWYYINTFVSRLGNFVPDTILREKGDVWIYKYRNVTSPDSVAYFVYCPTRNGTRVSQYPLKIEGPPNSGNAVEIDFSDNSLTGRQITRAITNGTVLIDAGERPKLVMIVEK